MDAERWRQVETLYYAAHARPANERAAFLAEVCAGDDELQRELASLLDAPATADGLLARPALALAMQVERDLETSLLTGRQFGIYRLLDRIGTGGMGEVYRARDTRLGRDVAIKILPPELNAQGDRLPRFEREARVLASLNHPNITTIHGVEESDGVRALVMELVEGDTLAERISSGPIPVASVLSFARQMAEALEAAHDKGIVHRDLKPANIKITPSGTVKVLDFGLAKAVIPGDLNLSRAAMTSSGGTCKGILLGTPAYMSPEQARGGVVDEQTDIWAFGCVLYEMLAGRAAFHGSSATDILSAVITLEPEWAALPSNTPAAVHRILHRCLQKDLKKRLRHIGDVSIELEEQTPALGQAEQRHGGTRLLKVAAMVLSSVAFGVGVSRWLNAPADPTPRIVLTLAASVGSEISPTVAIPSPDGLRAAFIAVESSGRRSIWVQSFDSVSPHRLEGTDGVWFAVGGWGAWAPDGRSLAFFAQNQLKTIDHSGGSVHNVAPINASLGVTRSHEGVIVYAPQNRGPLHSVAASGGTPKEITELNVAKRENSHRWPQFLPDGRHFLYTARSDVKENTGIYVGSLDSSERTWLMAAQSNAQYSPPGHLLFVRDGTLMVQPFDADTLQLSGEPVGLIGGVHQVTESAGAMFALAANGNSLAYLSSIPEVTRPSWFDRTGKNLGAVGPERDFQQIRLAPDESRFAAVVADAVTGNRDIWTIETSSGIMSRLVSHPATDWWPTWAPNSKAIVFASDRNGPSSLFRKQADPSAAEELLLAAGSRGGRFPDDWSADGNYILFRDSPPDVSSTALWALPLFGDHTPFRLSETRFSEIRARISPSGRWLTYVSNQSGSAEVFVKAFSELKTRRLSPSGGREPIWTRDGKVVFINAENVVTEVAWDDKNGLPLGPPRPLFSMCGGQPPARQNAVTLNVTADGQRLLMACPVATRSVPSISVVLNWASMLERQIR